MPPRLLRTAALLFALLAAPGASLLAQVGTTYLFTQGSRTFSTITGTSILSNQATFANDPSFGYGYDLAVTSATSIGFNFRFQGVPYTQFRASSSGLLIFGNPTVPDIRTNQLNAPQITAPIAAPFWEHQHVYDQNCVALTAGIRYELTGSAPDRVLTVQWRTGLVMSGSSYYSYTCPTTNTMYTYQVRLYEANNSIEFHYGGMYTGSLTSNASIGLAAGSNNFLSVTPGSPASTSSSSANNAVTMYTTPITSGTTYAFTPCGFELTGRTGPSDGGTASLANGDVFFQGFSLARGSAAVYTPFDIAVPGGVCPSRSYSAQIVGPAAADYAFTSSGTTTTSVSVAAGAAAQPLAIRFAPLGTGVRNATLMFTDAVTGATRTFTLAASATPRLRYIGNPADGGTSPVLDNDSLMLSIAVTRRQQQSFRPVTVENFNLAANFDASPQMVTATIDSAGGSSYQYKLVDPTTGALVDSYTKALAPGDTFAPRILFRATSAGKQVARLRITNPDGENRTLWLAATSAAPAGRFEIAGVSVINTAQFTTMATCAGEFATTLPMVVTNSGFGPLVLNGLDVYETDTLYQQGTPAYPLVRDGAVRPVASRAYGLFTTPGVAPLSANPVSFPVVIPEGGSRTLYLTFVADRPGKRWGRAYLRTNAQNVQGTDTAIAAMPGAVEGLVTFDLVGTGLGSQLAATPAGLKLRTATFGAVRVDDSVDVAIAIANAGACELRINRNKLRIFSGDVNEFRMINALPSATIDQGTGDYVLAPGAVDAITVRFKPSRPGTRMATLWLQTNDSTLHLPGLAERGAYYLDLTGRGLAGLDAHDLVLDPVVIGSSVAGAARLENSGTSIVGIASIEFLGGDAAEYSEDATRPWPTRPFTVLPGAKLELGVRLTPVGADGPRRTTLLLVTTGGDSVRLSVRGEAGTQTLVVSPSALFEDVTIAVGQSKRQTVMISNTGTLPLRITDIAITGADASSYRMGLLPRRDLDAGQTEYLELTYAPTAPGQTSAELVVTASNGTTASVTLGGTALKIRRDPIDPVMTGAPNAEGTPEARTRGGRPATLR